ncbi:hypothetical protein Tco_0937606 [Tanacetum coccineum]|uniref:Uncharacterized protein n=1 Tax=Tanacetum coccineum TaxID=301880 RepID=A0ABQ5DHK1_9ASTR
MVISSPCLIDNKELTSPEQTTPGKIKRTKKQKQSKLTSRTKETRKRVKKFKSGSADTARKANTKPKMKSKGQEMDNFQVQRHLGDLKVQRLNLTKVESALLKKKKKKENARANDIIVPVPDSSQHCAVCGTPVDGPYCHGCTLIRMKFEKDLFAYCVDNGVFQNFQDTSESSNDNTNVVNAPREPSVVDQDPGAMQNFLKKYDHIPHNEKSIKLLLAEEKFLKIKQVVEESKLNLSYFARNVCKDLL